MNIQLINPKKLTVGMKLTKKDWAHYVVVQKINKTTFIGLNLKDNSSQTFNINEEWYLLIQDKK